MFYTIIAATAYILSVILFVTNQVKLQNIHTGRFFDREYSRDFELVKATIDGVSIIGAKRYAITCRVKDSNDCVVIEVDLARLKHLKRNDELYLMKFTMPKAQIYGIAPISELELEETLCISKVMNLDADDVEDLDKKAQMAQKLNLAIIVIAFFTCPSVPLTSLLFSIIAVVMDLFIVPLAPWTRAKGFGIIKTQAHSNKARSKIPETPVGFEDWSDTNKELFSIERRLRKAVSDTVDDRSETEKRIKEDAATEKNPQNYSDNEDQQSDLSQSTPRFCKACGCIVSEHAQYCESCGNKLSDDGLPETVKNNINNISEIAEVVEQVETDSTEAVDITNEFSEAKQSIGNQPILAAPEQDTSSEPGKRQHRNRRQRKEKANTSNGIEEMLRDIANQG